MIKIALKKLPLPPPLIFYKYLKTSGSLCGISEVQIRDGSSNICSVGGGGGLVALSVWFGGGGLSRAGQKILENKLVH